MKILQRYILRELWLPFVLCFITLNFIFMAGYLARAADFIIGRGVPFSETLYILLLALPDIIAYTTPTSILTAVLIVFGGLSQNNEIRAVKASGINPILIMMPALLLSLCLSFLMLVFNDQITTNAGFELRRDTKKLLIKHPAALIEPGRFVKLTDSVIFLTKELHGNQMKNVVAYEMEEAEKPVRTVVAERGEIVPHKDRSELEIRLYDGSVSDSEDASVQSIQFKTYEFPTLKQEDIRQMKKKRREFTLAELLIDAGNKLSKKDRREVWASFHNRIAFAFGSFIFVFVGMPIAIVVRRGEIILSFAIAMMAASLYYVLFVGARTLSIQGILPSFIALWIPNILLAFLGVYLFKRALEA